MKPATIIWTILLIAASGYIIARASTGGMGLAYVRAVPITPEGATEPQWTRYDPVDPSARSEEDVELSVPRTVGIWVAALCTLAILSFLYGDNPAYKLAEAVFVGSSAAYAMAVGFWTGIVENLIGVLSPELMQATVNPDWEKPQNLLYIVPLILSILMLWRLAPVGGWISRWPLAFFIGATAGIRLTAYLESDFVRQIQSTIIPLIVMTEGRFDWETSLKNITIVVGVLSCLVYFFFSVEHTGVVGGISRLGIWFLMITFGAGFGYTVMGRIALISDRLEFLFDDWMWLIDPASKRLGM